MTAILYRGRLAPTPTGYLHLGHARTFWHAFQRAREAGGDLIYRNDDLDRWRCRPEYVSAAMEDLRWMGIEWTEGPDVGGMYAPYNQSQREHFYRHAWSRLMDLGMLYPSPHSRRDVEMALQAPHQGEEEVFPSSLRPEAGSWSPGSASGLVNWRFRVRDGETIRFVDSLAGERAYVAGRDFGDFIVWRKDDQPSYELACVVDDYTMCITEVVRGEDLLLSTARQLLLYRALGWSSPTWRHVPLLRDAAGNRLAKRNHALSLRTLRQEGYTSSSCQEAAIFLQ